MLQFVISRLIIPPSYQIFGATLVRNSKLFAVSASSNVTPFIYGSHAQIQRLYSQQATPEKMIANYEYIKKATSNQNILIVDVREPDEVKEHGKIPNSINIPLGNVTSVLSAMPENEFEKIYKRPKPKEETEIIFYCMIGKRSGMAQQNATNLGYKNAKNYLGSWTDWAAKSH